MSPLTDVNPDAWRELGPGVHVRRYSPFDVTVTVVSGSRKWLLVDTGASVTVGRTLRGDVAELDLPTPDPAAIVLTHPHLDHVLGAAAFPTAPVLAHASWETRMHRYLEFGRAELRVLDAAWDGEGQPPPPVDVVVQAGTTLRIGLGNVPDQERSRDRPQERSQDGSQDGSQRATERLVEITALTRPTDPGHSGADLVVHVPDADLLLAGDLVESARELSSGDAPQIGPDGSASSWADALNGLSAILTPTTTVVPGHGPPVGSDFVRRQAEALRQKGRGRQDSRGAEGGQPWDGASESRGS